MKVSVLFVLVIFCNFKLNASSLKREEKICFSISLEEADKNKLYLELSANSFIRRSTHRQPDYHLGLACIILEEHFEQYYQIKKFIGEKISSYFERNSVIFTAERVERYLVGSERNFYNSSLVIYPQNSAIFFNLNELIRANLKKWNDLNNTHFYFHEDYQEKHYKPHITILNEKSLSDILIGHANLAEAVEKAKISIIKEFYSLINGKQFRFKAPRYKYK